MSLGTIGHRQPGSKRLGGLRHRLRSNSPARATAPAGSATPTSSTMRLPNPAPHPDTGLLVLRLGLAAIMLFHGIFKATHGVAWINGPLSAAGLPSALAYGTYVAELIAPLLLIFGVWTRTAALIIAFDMVMAIYLARRGDIDKINPMSGGWAIELEAILLVAALALALAGAGRYGLTKNDRGSRARAYR
jgi:putative oxidoreductase